MAGAGSLGEPPRGMRRCGKTPRSTSVPARIAHMRRILDFLTRPAADVRGDVPGWVHSTLMKAGFANLAGLGCSDSIAKSGMCEPVTGA